MHSTPWELRGFGGLSGVQGSGFRGWGPPWGRDSHLVLPLGEGRHRVGGVLARSVG